MQSNVGKCEPGQTGNAQNAEKKKDTLTANIYHTNLSLFALPPPSCSKYRPQSSEPQTDGLSVSTTADGSQPNVRKLCDTPPPAPQAHTHNLAYYDNIICQVRPNSPHVCSPFFSPSIHLLLLSLSHHLRVWFLFSRPVCLISSNVHAVLSSAVCVFSLPAYIVIWVLCLSGFVCLSVSVHGRLSVTPI